MHPTSPVVVEIAYIDRAQPDGRSPFGGACKHAPQAEMANKRPAVPQNGKTSEITVPVDADGTPLVSMLPEDVRERLKAALANESR